MTSISHPEEKNPVDPCVVCGHELWCHQVPRPAAAAWHCNGHGPVCERFASSIAAKNAQAAEEAEQQKIIRELKAAAAAEVRWPLWGSLVDYVPCPKPAAFSTDRSANPSSPVRCRASWAEFLCDKLAGHEGKHHTYDGAHSWHQVDVPPGPFDVSDTPIKKHPAPLHRLGEVPRALRALASQIEFGSSKPGRTVGDWRPAYAGAGRSKLIDKILRHAIALAAGELLDEDGRPHAAAVLANTSFLLELEGI